MTDDKVMKTTEQTIPDLRVSPPAIGSERLMGNSHVIVPHHRYRPIAVKKSGWTEQANDQLQKSRIAERKVRMRTRKINIPNQQSLCVFPAERSNLAEAISELHLDGTFPVIVLIGGGIAERDETVTRHAIQTIAKLAEDHKALIICGGTDMGVMAEIGQARWQHHYEFPLIGITLEDLVTWPDGPQGTKFLWWGKERWPLAPHYSHFILVPGEEFGDESPWIVSAATLLSRDHPSVTILINGGEVSRKDIELSVESGRPVIALNHTGRLADELASQPDRQTLITIVTANIEQRIIDAVKAALSISKDVIFPKPILG